MEYQKKTCPRCGAELYEDMGVCYGCLYDFTRDEPRRERLLPEPPLVDGDGQDTAPLGEALACVPEEVGMRLSTASVDVWVGVPPEGLSLGRDPSNDVVLHSPAVSRRHLRLVPTSDGMEATDLDATNPTRYRGRDLRGAVIVPYGDSVDVCGCALTMTGPKGAQKSL